MITAHHLKTYSDFDLISKRGEFSKGAQWCESCGALQALRNGRQKEHGSPDSRNRQMTDLGAYESLKIDLEKEIYFFKYRIIIHALKANHGNVAAAAKQLMIHRTTLVMMMQKFNIKRCYYLIQGY